ncbi:hypothetical protein QF117_10935 [Vibrio sp. YMD68]|uniref:hypothetical protein n=1 Tax=Vibrio sp. YMD68 TaxID=3042300 RepID=UPI00249B13C7|nr:hypothetical protein [Vibrio sp. YMD68]WGW01303.1 hypothetical protein QF117_10935 [Vibrio sp. YMD68]
MESSEMDYEKKSSFKRYYLITFALTGCMVLTLVFKGEIGQLGFLGVALLLTVLPPTMALGAYIGKLFRDFCKPDFIMTSGAAETFKVKVFWMCGPQLIGAGVGFLLINNVLETLGILM